MHELLELKNASQDIKKNILRSLVEKIKHIIAVYKGDEPGFQLVYVHTSNTLISKVSDFLESCDSSKEKDEVKELLNVLDGLYRKSVSDWCKAH